MPDLTLAPRLTTYEDDAARRYLAHLDTIALDPPSQARFIWETVDDHRARVLGPEVSA